MSIELMTAVWARGPKNKSEMLVMLALADHADDLGVCWPSIPLIAKKSRMTTRTAITVLQSLEAQGWLTKEVRAVSRDSRRRGAGGKNNRYQLNAEKLYAISSPRKQGEEISREISTAKQREVKPREKFSPRKHVEKHVSFSNQMKKFHVKSTARHKEESPVVLNHHKSKTPLPPLPGGRKEEMHGSAKSQKPRQPGIHRPDADASTANTGGASPVARQSAEYAEPTFRNRAVGVGQSAGAHRPGGTVDALSWTAFKLALKLEFDDIPIGLEAKFQPLADGESDYNSAFRDMWLLSAETDEMGKPVLILGAEDPRTTQRGLEKYRARIQGLMIKHFGKVVQVQVRSAEAA